MLRRKGPLLSAAFFLIIFPLFAGYAASNVQAAAITLGPAWVNPTPAPGMSTTLYSTFVAPSNTNTQSYIVDTEIVSGVTGSRVAQFYETLQLAANQTVTRSYKWNTPSLASTRYIFKQGLFSPDWKITYGWNNASGSVTLTTAATPTSTTAPATTSAPATTTTTTGMAQQAVWQASAILPASSFGLGSTSRFQGVFGVAATGNYILDMELFDSASNKVGQYYETRAVTAGLNQSVFWNWQANTTGSFRVKMGIFTTNWQQKLWNDNAFNFSVVAATTSTPTPSSTPTTVPTTQTPTPTQTPAINPVTYMRGVNLAGAEFGAAKIPGVYGVDYTYPGNDELDYYISRGLNLVRIPFLWERLQGTLLGDLNSTELARLDAVVAAARVRGIQVILDPHNYDRYNLNGTLYLIGSSQVPTSAFADFWRKLAGHYKNETAIYAFSLMNEPHDTNGTWQQAAQAGLDGIRSADTTHLVLVPGDGWSGAWAWNQNNSNLLLKDPSNNLIYEAHQYFDRDGSGSYNESYDASGAYPMIGADRVQVFIDWLKTNGVRGIITEYGVPNDDPRWQVVLDNFLAKLDAAGVGGTYWAGGPWWGDYTLSAEPTGSVDKPVIATLMRHLSK